MLNLSIANVKTVTFDSELYIQSSYPCKKFNVSVYTEQGEVTFSLSSRGFGFIGRARLNGKVVAAKDALVASEWYTGFINWLCNTEDKEAILYTVENKFKVLRTVSQELNLDTDNSLAVFEQRLYKALQDYRYSNMSLESLAAFLKGFWKANREGLSESSYEKAKAIIVALHTNAHAFLDTHPQFKGNISRGVVLNFFYKMSSLYSSKYKELNVQKKAQYSVGLFVNRLLGYLNFRTKQEFSALEFKDMLNRFLNREAPYIKAEQNEEMTSLIRGIVLKYKDMVLTSDKVYRAHAVHAIQMFF